MSREWQPGSVSREENEPWPGAAGSWAPHRPRRRGLRGAAVEENSTIAPSEKSVKQFVKLTCGRSREAVGNCALRFADREVKAASRAQRGRSNAERLERVTRDRTIEPDGRWKQDADSPRSAGLSSAMPHSPARLRQRPAWRERPLLWPRARSQTRSDLEVAHATFLRLSASSSTARPQAAKTAARSLSSTTHTRCFSYGVVWRVNARGLAGGSQMRHEASRGEHLARRRVPPLVPLAA